MQHAPLDTPTLLRVRWFATATLGLLLLGGLSGVLPPAPSEVGVLVLLGSCAVNVALQVLGPRALVPALLADTALISVLLLASGGATNPLTLLFLYPVMLASLASSLAWTAALGLVTTLAFAALFAATPSHVHQMDMRQHVLGMVVAYGVTAPLLAAAVHRFRLATALAEAEVARARSASEAAARLTSLAALAGGAAHEIATPLSTILLIARELQRTAAPEAADDLEAIAEEVARCKQVLDHLALEAGAGRGEAPVHTTIAEVVREATRGFDDVDTEVRDAPVRVPAGVIAQAVRRLLGNARDASPVGRAIRLAAGLDDGQIAFEVSDQGEGMDAATLARACDPFFSTKPAGLGMGLGLFFVQSVATQLGGSFELHSARGQGTRARLTFPAVAAS
jgi:two-component system sensor histidine kinase RegB